MDLMDKICKFIIINLSLVFCYNIWSIILVKIGD